MNRRGFLGAMLAACAAPAVIRSGVLMPIRAGEIIMPGDEIELPDWLKVGASQTVSAGAGLIAGDVFTMAGVRDASGMLKRFVVTAVSAGGVLQIGGAA